MMKKLAELKIIKSADWKNEIVKVLEATGFVAVKEIDGFTEAYYIIAKEIEENE